MSIFNLKFYLKNFFIKKKAMYYPYYLCYYPGPMGPSGPMRPSNVSFIPFSAYLLMEENKYYSIGFDSSHFAYSSKNNEL